MPFLAGWKPTALTQHPEMLLPSTLPNGKSCDSFRTPASSPTPQQEKFKTDLKADNRHGLWVFVQTAVSWKRQQEQKDEGFPASPIFLTQAVAAGALHQSPAESQPHVQPFHSTCCLQCTVSTGPITCYSRTTHTIEQHTYTSPLVQACHINTFSFKFMLLYVTYKSYFLLLSFRFNSSCKKEDSVWIAGLQCWQPCQMLTPCLWILALATFSLERVWLCTSLITANVFMGKPRTSVRIYNSTSDELKNMPKNLEFYYYSPWSFFLPLSQEKDCFILLFEGTVSWCNSHHLVALGEGLEHKENQLLSLMFDWRCSIFVLYNI